MLKKHMKCLKKEIKLLNNTSINSCKMIEKINLNGTTTHTTLDLRKKVSSGMYFITLTSGNRTIIKKIIVQ